MVLVTLVSKQTDKARGLGDKKEGGKKTRQKETGALVNLVSKQTDRARHLCLTPTSGVGTPCVKMPSNTLSFAAQKQKIKEKEKRKKKKTAEIKTRALVNIMSKPNDKRINLWNTCLGLGTPCIKIPSNTLPSDAPR